MWAQFMHAPISECMEYARGICEVILLQAGSWQVPEAPNPGQHFME